MTCQFQILIAHEHNGKKVPAQFCKKRAKEIPVGLHMCKNHAKEFKAIEEKQPANAMLMIYQALKRRAK